MLLIILELANIPNPFNLILQHLYNLIVQFSPPVIIPLIKLSMIGIALALIHTFQKPSSMRYSVLDIPNILHLLLVIIIIKKFLYSYISPELPS